MSMVLKGTQSRDQGMYVLHIFSVCSPKMTGTECMYACLYPGCTCNREAGSAGIWDEGTLNSDAPAQLPTEKAVLRCTVAP